MTKSKQPTPGESLLHPITIMAICTLAINDHYFKTSFGNWWTGKISDFAGMIFFPILLESMYEWLCFLFKCFRPSRRVLFITTIATGLVFSLTNTVPIAADAYRWGLGLLQWTYHQFIFYLNEGSIIPIVPVKHVMDPTDLIALPCCGIALWIGWNKPLQTERHTK